MRKAELSRKTGETEVKVVLTLDGSGQSEVETGVGFLDHMLQLLAWHAAVDLEVSARGDLQVDDHHLVEDVGILLGRSLGQALGDRRGLRRFGEVFQPMDEVLLVAALDLSGRGVFVTNYRPIREKLGGLSTEMVGHFFTSVAAEAGCGIHLHFLEPGQNEHHRVEAMFKGFARCLRSAVAKDPLRQGQIPSSKGTLS